MSDNYRYRMLIRLVQQGRSERNTEAYLLRTSQVLSEARTQLASLFNILLVAGGIERHICVMPRVVV
ncbi:MAG: hypothetical protein K0S58_576 [Nitrospira sp.]|jgi:hypothetical protein|nr:hypothetical protein [Nitrospira sp.]